MSTCVLETHATHVHRSYRALLQHGAVEDGEQPLKGGSLHRGHGLAKSLEASCGQCSGQEHLEYPEASDWGSIFLEDIGMSALDS